MGPESLYLGPVGSLPEDIEVSRTFVGGSGVITVTRGLTTYSTGFTSLYGAPDRIEQGVLDESGQPSGFMSMHWVELEYE